MIDFNFYRNVKIAMLPEPVLKRPAFKDLPVITILVNDEMENVCYDNR